MSKPRLVRPSKVTVTAEVTPRDITFEGEDGAFHLTPVGVVVKGKPAFGEWENALEMAVYLEERSPFWKADLLEYGHHRPDWSSFLDAVVDASKFTESTVRQYRHVAKSVPRSHRVEGLSFSHHAEVASVPADEQREYLERAKRDHLSVSALRQVVMKGKKIRRILKGQASTLAKAHNVVVAHAHEAADVCRAIPSQDCKDAEKLLTKARRELDRVESAITAYRKAQGTP